MSFAMIGGGIMSLIGSVGSALGIGAGTAAAGAGAGASAGAMAATPAIASGMAGGSMLGGMGSLAPASAAGGGLGSMMGGSAMGLTGEALGLAGESGPLGSMGMFANLPSAAPDLFSASPVVGAPGELGRSMASYAPSLFKSPMDLTGGTSSLPPQIPLPTPQSPLGDVAKAAAPMLGAMALRPKQQPSAMAAAHSTGYATQAPKLVAPPRQTPSPIERYMALLRR